MLRTGCNVAKWRNDRVSGERRVEAESTPCGATFSTRNERPDAKRPPNSLPFSQSSQLFFPFFFYQYNNFSRELRYLGSRRWKHSVQFVSRDEIYIYIYPRNFNLIGKKRFRFVKRKGNRYMFPIRHSRLNFDRRATNSSNELSVAFTSINIRCPRSGWGWFGEGQRRGTFSGRVHGWRGVSGGTQTFHHSVRWGKIRDDPTAHSRNLDRLLLVVPNRYWSRRTWSR